MFGRGRWLTREQERDRILLHYGEGDFNRLSEALDRQFRTIHNRAQVLLGVCGILISGSVLVTTGRIIGRPTFLHQHFAGRLLIVAGVLEITAACVLVGGVLSVRWITQQPGEDLRDWVLSNLGYRDRKTHAYRLAILLVLLSMTAYQIAISVALARL